LHFAPGNSSARRNARDVWRIARASARKSLNLRVHASAREIFALPRK